MPLFEQDMEPDATEIPVTHYLGDTEMSYDNASTASLCSLAINDLEINRAAASAEVNNFLDFINSKE